jgi:hypothetical protein
VMANDDSTRGIAAEWWGELPELPTTHPPKRVSVGGEETLLILGDGRGGRFYPAFEGRYRVIEPSSDGVTLGPASTRSAANTSPAAKSSWIKRKGRERDVHGPAR